MRERESIQGDRIYVFKCKLTKTVDPREVSLSFIRLAPNILTLGAKSLIFVLIFMGYFFFFFFHVSISVLNFMR
jgi:hypothetical protein